MAIRLTVQDITEEDILELAQIITLNEAIEYLEEGSLKSVEFRAARYFGVEVLKMLKTGIRLQKEGERHGSKRSRG